MTSREGRQRRRNQPLIRFELPADESGQGTDLTWTLLVEEPEPHAELRYSFGQ